MRPDAVGLGWRHELAADLLATPEAVDFVEVVAETCFARPETRREARALAELWPVVPHGVKLSLGTADGIDLDRARQLGALARELSAPAISEHVALTRGGTLEIGHLTCLPYTPEAVRVVARNVAAARRLFPDVPLFLENVARTFPWPEDTMEEGDFYGEIVRATGCPLLLDVANLYANALNFGRSPLDLLLSYPIEVVGMIHLAGGIEEDGFYLDTHAHAVPDSVFELLQALFARRGPAPALVERDAGFPAFGEVRGELERVKAIGRSSPRASPRVPIEPAPPEEVEAGAMARRQARVVLMLTGTKAPESRDTEPFGATAIRRTREILNRKRVDDALPLLPRASRRGEALWPIALEIVRRTPREARSAGIADAVRIAQAACEYPALAPLAKIDLLELRSRFSGNRRPRIGPFVGRALLPGGRSAWALKGPGRHAAVRIWGDDPWGGEA